MSSTSPKSCDCHERFSDEGDEGVTGEVELSTGVSDSCPYNGG